MNLVNKYEISHCKEIKELFDDKKLFPLEKNTKHYSFENLVCSTCNQEIDTEISRILIMRDKDGGPRLFCFHFFFPCWNLEFLIQKYPNLIIDKAALSFPENFMISENAINDMQKNAEYWVPKPL